MVEQPFVPFGRDGAIAEGKDRVPRACSGTGTGSWNGEPVVVWLGEIMCGSEEGKIGGREGRREGGKGAEKGTLTGPRRRPWCSFHAPRPMRLLVR